MGKSYADYLVHGSQVAANLLTHDGHRGDQLCSPCEIQPIHEKQVRPLVPLKPEQLRGRISLKNFWAGSITMGGVCLSARMNFWKNLCGDHTDQGGWSPFPRGFGSGAENSPGVGRRRWRDRGERLLHGGRRGRGLRAGTGKEWEATPIPPTAPQNALHGPIEGRARVYCAASMLIWAAFGIPPPGAWPRSSPPLLAARPERKDTTSPFLPLNFRCRMEIGLEINFKTKRKGPLWGLKLLKSFGGRWATRTPGLWFRRPTLYPPELIARAKKFYQMHPPCQGNPEPGKEAGPGRRNRPAGLSAWQIFAAADLVAPEARPGGRPRSGADHRTGY